MTRYKTYWMSALLLPILVYAHLASATQAYVAGSSNHTLYVIGSTSSVYASGDVKTGAVSPFSTVNQQFQPIKVGLKDVISVAATYNKSIALQKDGSVWFWGLNNKNVPVKQPTKIIFNQKVVDMSASYEALYLVLGDGTVWSWKYDLGTSPTQVTSLYNIKTISSHMYHNTALGIDGSVWVWGRNNFGQLGDGTYADGKTPFKLIAVGTANQDVRACYQHTLVLTRYGSVKSFGNNRSGMLGDGSITNKNVPVDVVNLDNVVSIACGVSHSAAIKNDGSVWMWGWHNWIDRYKGTAKDVSRTATAISDAAGTKFMSTSWDQIHIIASLDGVIRGWGGNSAGKLGDGYNIERHWPSGINISVSNVVEQGSTETCNDDHDSNRGHGNDCDRNDDDNPGHSNDKNKSSNKK